MSHTVTERWNISKQLKQYFIWYENTNKKNAQKEKIDRKQNICQIIMTMY